MFETNNSENDRGQVGIGTLIVFIAMVLVAAIAAGVLINTAGDLQSQASDTGTETQQAVANQIEVVHAYADNRDDEDFEELNLVVKKSAGSDVIDMTSLTVQYTSESDSVTLAHDAGTDDPEFTTTGVTEESQDDSLTDTSDRIEVSIALTGDDEQPEALSLGDSATVQLVDQSGAQFSYGVTMPATASDDANIVEV